MLDVIARRIDGSPGFEHQRPEATLAQLLRRPAARDPGAHHDGVERLGEGAHGRGTQPSYEPGIDRKSTRLNSSHLVISYAVFCLKKKKKKQELEMLVVRVARILCILRSGGPES